MTRWIVISVLLVAVVAMAIWGAVVLHQPVPVVNRPVPKEEPKPLVIVPPPARPGPVTPAPVAPQPTTQPRVAVTPPRPATRPAVVAPKPPTTAYPLTFRPDGTIGGRNVFQQSLAGVAIDSKRNVLHAAGDSEVKTFDLRDGRFVRTFHTRKPPLSVTADPATGNVMVGESGRIGIYTPEGNRTLKIGEGLLGEVTAVETCRAEILAGDATARLIRRFDGAGKHLGDIPAAAIELIPGSQSVKGRPAPSLTLPNRTLDFAVAPGGRIIAAHPGRHGVETYDLTGKLLKRWGQYEPQDPKGFVGCCNPINVAVFPLAALNRPELASAGGVAVVTAEKAIARVKVYDGEGNLLGMIDPQQFNQSNQKMDLAVDGQGRIYVADTVSRVIRRFAPQR